MEIATEIDNVPQYTRELAIRIAELPLSVRARNALKNAEIGYVGDLVQLSEEWLLTLPNCGRKTVGELRDSLAELGLHFGIKLDDWSRPIAQLSCPPAELHFAELDENTRAKLCVRIDEIDFSRRAANILMSAGIEFVGDLVCKGERELRKFWSCGRLTVAEIKNKIAELGLSFDFSLGDWSADQANEYRKQHLKNFSKTVLRTLDQISPSEFLEDEFRKVVAGVGNERATEICLKQLGWSGKGARTLESVGQEYSVTRERIRQIVAKKTARIRKRNVDMPRLNDALLCIRARCPATAEELGVELRKQHISKSDFDPTGLKIACEVLGKEFHLQRMQLGSCTIYVSCENAGRIVEFFRFCRKWTASRGCANFEAVCDELRIRESESQSYRDIATLGSVCEWLDSERMWLFSTGVPRNRLSNLVSKVLSVSPQVYITEVRKAVTRSRRLAVVPPAGVLAKFVERFGLATVSDGRATAADGLTDVIVPGSTESIFVSILRTHGPLLEWSRFQQLCVAAGMNPITFGVYVSGSPIVSRVARGIYSLVGADIPPGSIEEIERQMVATRKSAEWGWTNRGTLWYALPINLTVLTAGSIPLPQFVADLVHGEWKGCSGAEELERKINCSNRFLWGFRRALVNGGAEPGDVAILEFDFTKRTVNITVGGEEFPELWESGRIELPVVEDIQPDYSCPDDARSGEFENSN